MSNIIYHELKLSNLLTIEHDFEWLENYKKENTLFPNCDTLLLPLTKREVNGFQVNSYEDIENRIIGPYDLYVVDGPFGSDRFSRYDIVRLLNNIDKGHEFIVIMDDAHRRGELDTLKCIVNLLERKGIYVSSSTYRENKDVLVLFTERYKFCSSL